MKQKIIKILLVVAFWPFTVPYLIWKKTNWTRNQKAIASIVFAVVVIFIFGLNSKGEPKTVASSASTVSAPVATEKPTATPKPTKSPEQVRDENIEAQSSAWDGSHRASVELIKENMNDPKSFEHVETRFWDMKDHLIVATTFRGKNGFGGVVKNMARTKVTLTDDGKMIDVELLDIE